MLHVNRFGIIMIHDVILIKSYVTSLARNNTLGLLQDQQRLSEKEMFSYLTKRTYTNTTLLYLYLLTLCSCSPQRLFITMHHQCR